MATTLQLVILLLALSVLVVALFRWLNLPPILGYLLVGAVIGPHALRLLPESTETRDLAEFGVVFLMFTIGLEFSLPRLYSMKRLVFGLGLAQVLLTMAAMLAIAWPLGVSLRPSPILRPASRSVLEPVGPIRIDRAVWVVCRRPPGKISKQAPGEAKHAILSPAA